MAKKELSPFEVAFAAARKAGEKEFEFQGKKYHTRTKEEDDKAKAAPKSEPTSAPKSDSVDLTKQSVARDTGGASAKLLSAAGMRKKESTTSTNSTTSATITPREKRDTMGKGWPDSKLGNWLRGLGKKRKESATKTPFGRKAREERMQGKKSGGSVKKMAKGGSVSKRADGCVIRGKTRGKIV